MQISEKEKQQFKQVFKRWRKDWRLFAKEALKVKLDPQMESILFDIQNNRRVSVCSCTSRGKDFLMSVASLCALYLTAGWNDQGVFEAAKVICTGPTSRQVQNIMMREIKARFNGSILAKLARYGFDPGRLLVDRIQFDMPESLKGDNKFSDMENWYLLGFKADNTNTESWTGFHSQHPTILVTEATGVPQLVFDGIEGCLQADSRLVLAWNPNTSIGEAYQSSKDPQYKFHRLSAFDAPNVINGLKLHNGEITKQEYNKLRFPGAVDFEWVDQMVNKIGWTIPIEKEDFDPAKFDFEWLDKYYRPSTVFKCKVMGIGDESGDDRLIPLSWIEAAMDRWVENRNSGVQKKTYERIRGKYDISATDIAGMGRDSTVTGHRIGDHITNFEYFVNPDPNTPPHKKISNLIAKTAKNRHLIDTIGEGAGVYANLAEVHNKYAASFKGSYGAKGLRDVAKAYKFKNMRAYAYWGLRDALDPQFGREIELPPNDQLKLQLSEMKFEIVNGYVLMEPKEQLKKRIGCSPDEADVVSMLFAPQRLQPITESKPLPKSLGRIF